MTPIRVVVVDDHLVVREGLRAMLDGMPEVAIVGEAQDLAGALAEAEAHLPDIVLLDLRLQGANGLEVCRALVERLPDLKVVILTVYEDEQYVLEALRAGARGYVLKKVAPEELVRTLQEVQAGEVVVDPALAGRIALRAATLRPEDTWAGAEFGLTQRESEVLAHLVRGMNNRAIARALYVSEDTVKTHVRAVLRKLDARDRTQAVAIALRRGLVP